MNNERKVVAIVYDDDGEELDRCYTWEAGQNYAMHEGKVVKAVADDGRTTIKEAQALYDYERTCYIDCFGEKS